MSTIHPTNGLASETRLSTPFKNILAMPLVHNYKEEYADNTSSPFLLVVGAYVVRTSSLNDKHSCQLYKNGFEDKTTPTYITPLIMANMSCG